MTSTACLGCCLGKNRPADPKLSWLLTRCGKRPMTSVDGSNPPLRHDCLIAQASFHTAFLLCNERRESLSLAPLLPRPIHFRMHHSHVSRKRIVARKGLFFRAQMTPHFLLARIVDRVLMPCQIIRPREDRVAWFARRRIDSLALVGASLRIAQSQ